MKHYDSIEKTSFKANIKKEIIVRLPDWIYKRSPWENNHSTWLRLYYRVSNGKKKSNLRNTVIIQQEVPQFNFWVFNKIFGMIGYFEYTGCQYSIEVNAQEEGFNVVKSFFEINDGEYKEYDVKYDLADADIFNLDYFNIYDYFERKLMCKFYQRYFKLAPDFYNYVQEDLTVIKGKRVLGVLMRGTDYTRKKPKGHPIQPEKEEMLEDIKKIIDKKRYKYIYLTTDEHGNEEFLRNNLGEKCEILVNRREYFDEFYKEGIPYISSCRHEREQDRLLTSKEYLSSIIILSRCNELLAGNCGGSRAAIYLNNGAYENVYLYDKGCYD